MKWTEILLLILVIVAIGLGVWSLVMVYKG